MDKNIKLLFPYGVSLVEVKQLKKGILVSYNIHARNHSVCYENLGEIFENQENIKKLITKKFLLAKLSLISVNDSFFNQNIEEKAVKKLKNEMICLIKQGKNKDILVPILDTQSKIPSNPIICKFPEYNSHSANYEERLLYLAYLIKSGFLTWNEISKRECQLFLLTDFIAWSVLNPIPNEMLVEIEIKDESI